MFLVNGRLFEKALKLFEGSNLLLKILSGWSKLLVRILNIF